MKLIDLISLMDDNNISLEVRSCDGKLLAEYDSSNGKDSIPNNLNDYKVESICQPYQSKRILIYIE